MLSIRKMRGSLFLFFFSATFIFAHAQSDSTVKYVLSENSFYDIVNRNDSYTVVKYFTTWCSHCKTLKPIFEELSATFNADVLRNLPIVNYVEVNCEGFESTLCKGLPGFPMVHIIRPNPEAADSDNELVEEPPLWRRITNKILRKPSTTEEKINPSRIVPFKGRRDLESLKNFIGVVISKDKLKDLIEYVVDMESVCDNEDIHCQDGKKYMKTLIKNKIMKNSEVVIPKLIAERTRLENMIRNTYSDIKDETVNDSQNLLRFHLSILDFLEDSYDAKYHDEL